MVDLFAGAGGFSEVFSGSVPTAVYEVVKQQPVIKTKSGGTRTTGLSFNSIPKEHQIIKTRPEVVVADRKFAAYKNKTSQFQGITKIGGPGGAVMGFRRVSANSDPSSWIHTGISARNLADKVIQDLDIESEKKIQSINN